MSKYLKANSDYWSQAVYDNPNPESYVFRMGQDNFRGSSLNILSKF